MTIRSKSTMIHRVSVALLTAATIGSVIAGSAAPAAAGTSKVKPVSSCEQSKAKTQCKLYELWDQYVRG